MIGYIHCNDMLVGFKQMVLKFIICYRWHDHQ
jgi:hypothetical protein